MSGAPAISASPSRRPVAAVACALAGLALAAWANSFSGPFILDDPPAITENPTIRSLADLRTVFAPPANGETVTGRPLLNLSLALNWHVGGDSVRGYHAVNLAIHLAAALALFGLVRRTLLGPRLAATFGPRATPLAAMIAALWLVHPLQTESVTYIVQRAESLVGLWLLLTLYAATRAAVSPRPAGWHLAAVTACLLGMATKEVMFAAPILVWLHAGLFFAPSLRAAWRARRGFYLALAATWLLLAWLVLRTGDRGATAGFGVGISPWHYLLTQCGALLHYVRLAAWPVPLILDYGFDVVTSPLVAGGPGLVLLAAFAATVVALIRGHAWAFLGAWFFLLLGPSSSVVPVATQTIAEHRMYLPLAALVAGAVLAVARLGGPRAVWPLAGAALAGVVLVHDRNLDYRSTLAIWHDTAVKRPSNARAHQELGLALKNAGRARESLPHFERALALVPHYDKGRHNYATALSEVGEFDAAARQFDLVLARDPAFADSLYGLGNVRRLQGNPDAAIAAFRAAVRIRPNFANAHNNLALLLFERGETAEALAHFDAALRADPDFVVGLMNRANALFRLGRPADAARDFEHVLRLAPASLDARENLGVCLIAAGRAADGIRLLEETARLAPDRASVHNNLAAARARLAAP